jgi:hypothetical protein
MSGVAPDVSGASQLKVRQGSEQPPARAPCLPEPFCTLEPGLRSQIVQDGQVVKCRQFEGWRMRVVP